MKHIFKCSCGRYSLKQLCPVCNKQTFNPTPPKYSPDDRFASYRRKVKYGV